MFKEEGVLQDQCAKNKNEGVEFVKSLIKATKSGKDFVIMKVVSASKKYPNRFYISREVLKTAIKKGYAIDKDIYNFAEISCLHDENLIKVVFSWLDGSGTGILAGRREEILLNGQEFTRWLKSKNTEYKALSLERGNVPNKVVITDSARDVLKNILGDKDIKKKFVKAFSQAFLRNADRIYYLYSDFVENSFVWVEEVGGKRGIVGGLIFRTDRSNPTDLRKASYSMHT